MHQWDSSLFSVTPAASMLSRCVCVGAAAQGEIDSAFSDSSPTFSSHLQEVEEQIRKQKELDELELQLELLRLGQEGADVTHVFHLAQKNERLQTLGDHLLNLLKEQKILKQRLTSPLSRTNLPVVAHLKRFVVETGKLLREFIECLEEKIRSARNQKAATDGLALLDLLCSVMLTLAAETETLSDRILELRNIRPQMTSVASQTTSSAAETD